MPFNWFRRRKPEREQAPVQAAAPVTEAPDKAGRRRGRTDTKHLQDPKRRRGTRGGKGRSQARRRSDRRREKEKAEARPLAGGGTTRTAAQRPRRTRRATPRDPRRAPLPAAKRELLVSVDVSEQRVAVLEDDRVAEVYLERPERRSIAGNIYLGVVDNVLPGMEAAFVEIGLERNGFLYVDEIVRPKLEGQKQGKRIQDLLSRGEHVLVQAVKDPMKSKGARLTMEISLPGRFVVFVPNGEGLGVSRRLEDDERTRLKEILKQIDVKKGGVIVRTAAEGASAEDVERDLVFLQKLWKTIEAQAKKAKAPTLIYQEAELPLRVTRDLFTENFERAYVDDDKAFRRITGYLKKTSPHMVERVIRYKEKEPLLERYGVDAEIRSTLSRRVDLPSGGYLVFDYAEAFTVIDVNTGRFVGSRSKTSASRLEDTITKNNLEAVKEVVRQLRLRDIGGIIVIDFIDMANPKNRQAVEDALRTELERDRTKTYVVEISPLGLVEMTRQNVTEGPREILTRKCPTCGGDGVVISEQSAAIDLERRLRTLARGSRVQAYRVEVNARVASLLIGSGRVAPAGDRGGVAQALLPRAEGGRPSRSLPRARAGQARDGCARRAVRGRRDIELQPVEVGLHDPQAAVAKLDGYDIVVAGAARLVGKKVKVQVERVLPDGVRDDRERSEGRLGADHRGGRGREADAQAAAAEEGSRPPREAAAESRGRDRDRATSEDERRRGTTPKKKTRRGSRGGRRRKKAPTIHVPEAERARTATSRPQPGREPAPVAECGRRRGRAARQSRNGAERRPRRTATPKKRKTRRGSRGGRNRRKKPAAAAPAETGESG